MCTDVCGDGTEAVRVLCTVQGVIRDENLELHNGRVRDRGTIVGVVNIVCSDRTGLVE